MLQYKVLIVFVWIGQALSLIPKDYGLTACSSGGPTLVPHPEACQRYYNCSDTAERPLRSYLGAYEVECPYPQLFDLKSLACQSFKGAYCGDQRVAAKDPCEYVANQCLSAHCQPCNSRLPSCVGLKDGPNVFVNREWSPHYIKCDTQRLNGTFTCGAHQPSNTVGIFSVLKLKCVSLWEVPTRTGFGLAPTCADKLNGYYVTKERPDIYYACPSARVFYCTPPAVFDRKLNSCR